MLFGELNTPIASPSVAELKINPKPPIAQGVKMKQIALVLGLLLSLSAHATGSFSCEYTSENLELVVVGVTTRSFQNAIVDANARLTGTMGDDGLIFKADQSFVKSDIRQYWNSGDEFRVLLYAETDDSTTKVTIKTKDSGDGIVFSGTISIQQTQAKGEWSIEDAPVSCELE
jgi:hypothetical protein